MQVSLGERCQGIAPKFDHPLGVSRFLCPFPCPRYVFVLPVRGLRNAVSSSVLLLAKISRWIHVVGILLLAAVVSRLESLECVLTSR